MGALQRSLRGDPDTTQRLQTVRARYRECLEALRLLGQSSDGWAFAEEAHGATTHYRHDAAGRLWLRTEGVMKDIGCLECIALWKEVDLFDRWFPLCQGARALAAPGRVELLAWFELAVQGLPLGKRDAVLQGYGVDALSDGFMMVIGRSAAQSDWPQVPFPPLEGFGAARMHVAGLQVLVQPLSDRSVRCCYCCHIDIRAPLPRPMLRLATQHVVGRIFHALQQEARKIRRGAEHSAHAAP